jgi:hypothetical protein
MGGGANYSVGGLRRSYRRAILNMGCLDLKLNFKSVSVSATFYLFISYGRNMY